MNRSIASKTAMVLVAFCGWFMAGAGTAATPPAQGVATYDEQQLRQLAEKYRSIANAKKLSRSEFLEIKQRSFKGFKLARVSDRKGVAGAAAMAQGFDNCREGMDCNWMPEYVDLGADFGVWQMGEYMNQQEFWFTLFAESSMVRQEQLDRVPVCVNRYNACHKNNQMAKVAATAACSGVAGKSPLAGGACQLGVEVWAEWATEDCNDRYVSCIFD